MKRGLNIRVARRGTYCETEVPDSSYFRAHPCSKKPVKRQADGQYKCPWHRKKP